MKLKKKQEIENKLNYVRNRLNDRFHLSEKVDENTIEWILFYGADDFAFYFSNYCKSIMDSKNNTIEELVEFTNNYISKTK